MKRIASIGLILLMSLQCFYKLGVVTYFQLNRDYIAKVLCINKEEPVNTCHGQCFLKRNLEATDDKSIVIVTERTFYNLITGEIKSYQEWTAYARRFVPSDN